MSASEPDGRDNNPENTAVGPGSLPRLIATDLDGTVIHSDGTTSLRTRAVFQRAVSSGVHVVAVTGRGPRLLNLIRHDLPAAGFLVCSQGAYVVELCAADEPLLLFSASLDVGIVAQVIGELEAVVGPLSLLVEPLDSSDNRLHGELTPKWRRREAVRQCSRSEALSGPIIKAFVYSEIYGADDLLGITARLPSARSAEFTHVGTGHLEICPPGVTKATGVAVVADRLGISPGEVLVFGDMPNDLAMFSYAGWGRVAVGNAHPSVLAAADAIILANDEDGVARYLEALLAGSR